MNENETRYSGPGAHVHGPRNFYSKRSTQVADENHRDLPLHIQDPPVNLLDWERADKLIDECATEDEKVMWTTLTAIHRIPEAVKLCCEWALNNGMPQTPHEAKLLADDMEKMLKAKFCFDTNKTPASFMN